MPPTRQNHQDGPFLPPIFVAGDVPGHPPREKAPMWVAGAGRHRSYGPLDAPSTSPYDMNSPALTHPTRQPTERAAAAEIAEAPQPWGSRIRSSTKLRLAVADTVAVVLAVALAWTVRNPMGQLDAIDVNVAYPLLFALTPLVFLIAMASQRLYTARCLVRRAAELRRLSAASIIAGLGVSGIGFMIRADISRAWVLLLVAFAFTFLSIEREVARRVFAQMRASGRFLRPVLIVGTNAEAHEIGEMFAESPELGYRPVGYHAMPSSDLERGGIGDLVDDMEEREANGVVIAGSAADLVSTGRLVRKLTDRGIHVEVSSPLRDIAYERLLLRPIGRFPMTYVEPVHRSGWRQVAKRSFDAAVSAAALLALAPVLALVAVAVRLDSRGPALFRQERVGKDGQRFEVVKFRTMVVDAEERREQLLEANEADGPLFKMRDDPRVTGIGGFLRRSSLDELPQLWNVLRGDMSLVGPRPALPDEVAAWPSTLHERLRVKPGITGMWQVHGRSSASFGDYERLDLYYVDNWSLLTDLSIVAKTVPAVLTSRGAY